MKLKEVLKRSLCTVLAFLMLVSAVPANAFVLTADAAQTDGLCEHHQVHENCGYMAPVAGHDCAHGNNHDETCGYREGTAGIPCDHTHGGEECGTPTVSYPN